MKQRCFRVNFSLAECATRPSSLMTEWRREPSTSSFTPVPKHCPVADMQAFTVALNVCIIYGATVGVGKPDSGMCSVLRLLFSR